MMTITTKPIGRSWRAECIWAVGIAPTESQAVVNVAKCLASRSKPLIAVAHSATPLAPVTYATIYATGLRHNGASLLAHNIKAFTRSA